MKLVNEHQQQLVRDELEIKRKNLHLKDEIALLTQLYSDHSLKCSQTTANISRNTRLPFTYEKTRKHFFNNIKPNIN